MKKRIIIGLTLILILSLIGLVVFCIIDRKGEKSFVEEFSNALKNEKEMEKFAERYIDFKTALACEKVAGYGDYPRDLNNIEELQEEIEAEKEKLTEEEIKLFKEEKIKKYKEYCDENLLKIELTEEEKTVNLMKQTFEEIITNGNGSSNRYSLLYYKGNVIDIDKFNIKGVSGDYYKYNCYKLKPYIGEGIKGSEVRSMLDEIISINDEYKGEKGKFIGIRAKSIERYNKEQELFAACQNANIYEYETGKILESSDNTTINNNEAIEQIKYLKSKINSQKKYNITAKSFKDIIVWITIEGVQ